MPETFHSNNRSQRKESHLAHVVSHLPDILWLILTAVVLYLVYSNVSPWIRPFRLDDPDISYIYVPQDTVSMTEVIVFCVVLPPVVVVAWCLAWMVLRKAHPRPWLSRIVARKESKGPHWHLYSFIVAHLLNIVITVLITEVVKRTVGRLRPDFLYRCIPNAPSAAVNPNIPIKYFYDNAICTGDPKIIEEGRLSFPSGHASTSFAGLTFFSLWLFAITRPLPVFFVKRFDVEVSTGHAIRMSLSIAPVLGAAYIAISRTQQNVHNPTDVIAGSLLGAIVAYWFWYIYFQTELRTNLKQMKKEERWERLHQKMNSIEYSLINNHPDSDHAIEEHGGEPSGGRDQNV